VNSSITQVAPFAATGSGKAQPLCTGEKLHRVLPHRPAGYPLNYASPEHFSTLLAQTRYIPKNIPPATSRHGISMCKREIMKNTVLTASYIGEHGVHIWVLADLNQAQPNATGGTAQPSGAAAHHNIHRYRGINSRRLPQLQRTLGETGAPLLQWTLPPQLLHLLPRHR